MPNPKIWLEEMISKIEREINGDNCFDTLKESQLAKDQLPPYHTDESNDELPWMSHQQKESFQPLEILEDHEGKVSKIEKKDVSIFAFPDVVEICEMDEKNVNEVSNYFPDDYPNVGNEIFNVIEEHNSLDSSFTMVGNDQISDISCFEDSMMLNNISDQRCVKEKAEMFSVNHPTENIDEEINATTNFEHVDKVMQQDRVLDKDFSSLETKLNQFMVPATYHSSMVNLDIEILNPDEYSEGLTNAKDEEVVSILVEPVSNKESSSFSPGLKFEVNNACNCFDVEHVKNGDAFFSSGSKSKATFDSACK